LAGTADGPRLTTISKAVSSGCHMATTLSQMTSILSKAIFKQLDFSIGFERVTDVKI
jgi:hypothetical protein